MIKDKLRLANQMADEGYAVKEIEEKIRQSIAIGNYPIAIILSRIRYLIEDYRVTNTIHFD